MSTLFLFDVDATLLLTGGAGARALDAAFEEAVGLTGAMAGVDCGGKTDPLIVREVLRPWGLEDEARVQAVLRTYVRLLPGFLQATGETELLPGVRASLDELARLGLPRGLATGNLEQSARAKLARVGLLGAFTFGGYGSDAEDRSTLVAIGIERGRRLHACPNARAIVVGDTPRDVEAAHRAGAIAVAVASGSFGESALLASGAELVLPDLTAPAAWIRAALECR